MEDGRYGTLGWTRGHRGWNPVFLHPPRGSAFSQGDNIQTEQRYPYGKGCCAEECAKQCGNTETRDSFSLGGIGEGFKKGGDAR